MGDYDDGLVDKHGRYIPPQERKEPYQSPLTRRFVKVQKDHRAGRTTIVAEKEVAL